MLAQIRKHGRSWGVKLLFGVIALIFIFFFGYDSLQSRFVDAQRYVAQVDEKGIPRRKYEMTYQASVDRFREAFKGEVPEAFLSSLRQNVLDQLITREILAHYAKDMGLTVKDEDVAKAIQEDKSLFPDGRFDLSTYEQKFLPYYRQTYGEHFEDAVSRDLLIDRLRGDVTALFGGWAEEMDKSLQEHQEKAKKTAKKEDKKSKKSKKDKKPETQPETLATAPVISSITPDALFMLWLNYYRQDIKVQVNEP